MIKIQFKIDLCCKFITNWNHIECKWNNNSEKGDMHVERVVVDAIKKEQKTSASVIKPQQNHSLMKISRILL